MSRMPGYYTKCKFFADSDQLTGIHWYRVPKDRPCNPFPSIIEDSDWRNDNGPRSRSFKGSPPYMQGEQWEDRPATRDPPLPGNAFTGHICGTAAQWAGDMKLARAADRGTYGCCVPDLVGAYDCGYSDGYDNFGPPCPEPPLGSYYCGFDDGYDNWGPCP
jgi:hypothetical protein